MYLKAGPNDVPRTTTVTAPVAADSQLTRLLFLRNELITNHNKAYKWEADGHHMIRPLEISYISDSCTITVVIWGQ